MAKEQLLGNEQRRKVGELIKELRVRSELTPLDVAIFLRVPTSHIYLWEMGKRAISPGMALSVIDALATEEDSGDIQSLIATIPALDVELRVKELLSEANDAGTLKNRGIISSITRQSGMGYQRVRNRVIEFRNSTNTNRR